MLMQLRLYYARFQEIYRARNKNSFSDIKNYFFWLILYHEQCSDVKDIITGIRETSVS